MFFVMEKTETELKFS